MAQRTRTGPLGLPLDISVYPVLNGSLHRPDASVVSGQSNAAYPASNEQSNKVSAQSLATRKTIGRLGARNRTSPAGSPYEGS